MLIKERFELLKGYENNHVTVGFGSYGQVKLAKDLETGNIVAVKINKIAKNEVLMHYGLSHPKIIHLIDIHIDSQRQITYLIMQYADGGTLYDKIKMNPLSRQQVKKYFRDICEALAYLHSQNIMHRDIKPQNVLLNKNDQAKLCDFGFAALLGQRKTLCGTYEYMSPEMIQGRPYDYKIDIWAVGILLFELIAGNAPFRGDKPEQVLERMKTKIFFCDRFEQVDIHLIKTILRVTPQKRPEINEILKHPFFDEKGEKDESYNQSTTHSDESHNKTSLQYLSDSCNPQKMIEFQKLIERQTQKDSHQQHPKQTYPPFPIPKTQQKVGTGMVQGVERKCGHSPVQQQRHSPINHSRHSPLHAGKLNQSITSSIGNNNHFNQIHYKTFGSGQGTARTGVQQVANSEKKAPQLHSDRAHPSQWRFS